LEERRELIEKGGRAREEKGKGQGVTGKMLFFFLPPIQNRGGDRMASADGGQRRPRGRRRPGVGEKRRG
jgi:hypothetical protein